MTAFRKGGTVLGKGDSIPYVTLVDDDGASVALTSLIDRPIVLYFYPKDDTPGCTAEACRFRDEYEAFVDAGADVIGVSSDGAQSHARFRERHRLPFRLMSDPGGAARKAFGIPATFGILPGRATFVIARDAKILYSFNSQFAPHQHVQRALSAVRGQA
ncbi:MAG TPA: peroxiredoxin [Candidatus Acidoferrales bacterium]|nr:peroxiredoxin [Candidatus Acidoferrales bacterium]